MMKPWYFLLVVLVIGVLSGCTGSNESEGPAPLTHVDFATVCAGQALPRAASYTPDSPPTQLLLLSDSTIGAQYDEYSTRFPSGLPAEWFPQIVDGLFDYSPVELVACIHRTAVELVDACEFEDGYSLNVHNAEYEVSLFVAQTGEQLVTETVSAAGECPTMHMFDEDQKEEMYYADISEEQIRGVIAPFMP